MVQLSQKNLVDQYTEVVKSLAALALYDENVEFAVQLVVDEACFFLSKRKTSDPKMHPHAFKCRLKNLANSTHASLSEYRKVLEYAASMVSIK